MRFVPWEPFLSLLLSALGGTIRRASVETLPSLYLNDGSLLVCFLGDPRVGARVAPRLAVWREHGPLEEVEVSEPVARMVGRLALPPEPNLSGAGERGKADRIAAALGSPLGQRSAKDLQAALGYRKTQEWRVRRELLAALESHGLGDHLDAGRGRIGLRDAVSDVAALVGAVRHGERDLAVRLVEAVGEGIPGRVDWVVTEGWRPFVRDAAGEALAEAKRWQAEPRHLPAPADGPVAGEALPVPSASTLPVPWATRPPTGRPSRRKRRLLLAAASIAVVAAAAVLALGPLGGSSPSRAEFPGSWPIHSGDGYDALVANLTDEVPPEFETAARRGDLLLLRQRLPGGRRHRPGPVAVSLDLSEISSEGIFFYTLTKGFSPELRAGWPRVLTGDGDDRIRVVPSTTELVEPDGDVVRELPDLRFGEWDRVGKLPGTGPYFVDTQLRVVRAAPGAPGQIAGDSGVRCEPTETDANTLEVPAGTVADCTARLVNLGPSVLPSVRLRIGCTAQWIPRYGWSYDLQVRASSPAAEPETTSLSQGVAVSRGNFHGIEYVKGSAKLLDASLESRGGDLALREGRKLGELTIGPLEPGVANALFVRFKARIG
jgi:hypothetical protein